MSGSCYIQGVRVVDSSAGVRGGADLFVTGGKIAPLPSRLPRNSVRIDGRGLVAVPGFTDLHVHLREPGNEGAETVASGSRAAARGGFTTIVAMPNTEPACDSAGAVARVLELGKAAGFARVLPAGSMTVGRAGREVAGLAAMAEAGAVAFTDDGATPSDAGVVRQVMKEAGALGLPVMDHAQQPDVARGGVMHEGEFSRKLGLAGMPSSAETAVVERDIALCAETGCCVHVQHVSCAESLELIRAAKARGLPVTCEVTPHHLVFCDADVRQENASFKMNPPLRSARDREALRLAVAEGVVDAFATDHAPHTAADKARGFQAAPFGVVGLETAAAITYTELVKTGVIGLERWVSLWTCGPAAILGTASPSLKIGERADIALFDFETLWTVAAANFLSLSKNTPFEGRSVCGRAVHTMCGGRSTWSERT